MATRAFQQEGPTGLSTALSLIPSLPRPLLSRLVARAIERLDEIDGDPDLEDDDPSGQMDEDGINTGSLTYFLHGRADFGPGCPISDSDRSDLER